MNDYPCHVGAEFKDKYTGEIATVCGFRKRGAGWQVMYSTPELPPRLSFRQAWGQFKRSYAAIASHP